MRIRAACPEQGKGGVCVWQGEGACLFCQGFIGARLPPLTAVCLGIKPRVPTRALALVISEVSCRDAQMLLVALLWSNPWRCMVGSHEVLGLVKGKASAFTPNSLVLVL